MHRPQLAGGINDYSYTAGYGLAVNTRNKCLLLCAGFADANGVRLSGVAQHVCSNVDIVISGREILTRQGTNCGIKTAAAIIIQRLDADGSIGAPGIITERIHATGRVECSGGVVKECKRTIRSIGTPICILE